MKEHLLFFCESSKVHNQKIEFLIINLELIALQSVP